MGNKPVVLISMDGVGVAAPGPGNAVTLANTPTLDKLWPTYPHTYLEASGIHVGLPAGVDGNSEVGHATMGSGKIIYQDLPRIDNAVTNHTFNMNPVLKNAFAHARTTKGNIHLLGLVGKGKVHASNEHLWALLDMAVAEKCDPDKVFIHVILDGRDSPPKLAYEMLELVKDECMQRRMGRVVSMMGRYYAMDRDRRWERTKLAYDLLASGKGHVVIDTKKAIDDFYRAGKTDEFIEPCVILANKNDKPITVGSGDAVIFYNFRPDRAIQISRAFDEDDFSGFERKVPADVHFVGMTEYSETVPKKVAFPVEKIENYLGKVISSNKLTQLRLAESEKFAHVTYFFNAGNRDVSPGEVWVEVPSPKEVATYDQKPEMSQKWVTDVLLEKLERNKFDFAVVNFAGPDMVAHTGVIDATVNAMQVTDECIGRIIDKVLGMGGAVLITADHGNAEEMLDLQTGEPDTKHSTNQVPFIVVQEGLLPRELPIGNLADVAPTVLSILGISKPAEMTGRSLL